MSTASPDRDRQRFALSSSSRGKAARALRIRKLHDQTPLMASDISNGGGGSLEIHTQTPCALAAKAWERKRRRSAKRFAFLYAQMHNYWDLKGVLSLLATAPPRSSHCNPL